MQVGAIEFQPLEGAGFVLLGRFAAGTERRHGAPCLQRMLHGVQQVTAGLRVVCIGDVFHTALRHQLASALACAGSDVDDVVGASNGVFVVLHHHQGVAFVA